MRAGSMQLRKLRQLCERLFKLPSLPAVHHIQDPEGTAMQCSAAEGATLADLDVLVRRPYMLLQYRISRQDLYDNAQKGIPSACGLNVKKVYSKVKGVWLAYAGWIRDHPCYGGRCAK